jgi:hypothetical protein
MRVIAKVDHSIIKTALVQEIYPYAHVGSRPEGSLAHDVSVGGSALAAHAIRAGLVDEYHTVGTTNRCTRNDVWRLPNRHRVLLLASIKIHADGPHEIVDESKYLIVRRRPIGVAGFLGDKASSDVGVK